MCNLNLNKKDIIQSITMGLVTVLVGYCVYKITKQMTFVNDKQKALLNLFVTGVLVHYLNQQFNLQTLFCKDDNC